MKKFLFAALMLGVATSGGAHEIWIERDGNGPARVYLGEPAEVMPQGGDPEFAKLKSPHFLSKPSAAPVRKAGYLEASVPSGDVRVWDDNVFTSWGPEGRKENVVYYARAGRTETRAALPFEFVPKAAGGDRFALIRDGKPVPGATVAVIGPGRKSQELKTDARGEVEVPKGAAGRYLLTTAAKDEGAHRTAAGPVAILHRITTLSFVRN
jgi:hypothetical protein